MHNWRVIWTAPGGEAQTAQRLEAAGFEVFLPLATVRRPEHRSHYLRRRRVFVELPLFPRYLFAASVIWSRLLAVPGVRGLVCVAGQPASVRPDIVAAIREACANGVFDEHWRAGDVARIRNGPLAGTRAAIEACDEAREKVAVLIEIFGREVKTTLQLKDLMT